MIYYLSLGSNLGDRLTNLQNAVKLLSQINMTPVYFSAVYETSYIGDFGPQPDYLNTTIGIKSPLIKGDSGGCNSAEIAESPASAVIDRILEVEAEMGREKVNRNSERIIDIDLLLCGKNISEEKKAVVPHPRLHERLFVLTPLREIAEKEKHPILDKTIEELYIECLKKSKEKIKLFAPAFKLEIKNLKSKI